MIKPRSKECFGVSRHVDEPEDRKPPQMPHTDIKANFSFDAEGLDNLERLVNLLKELKKFEGMTVEIYKNDKPHTVFKVGYDINSSRTD